MAWTRSTLRTKLRTKLSELTAGTWSDADINGYITDGEKRVCEEAIIQDEHAMLEETTHTALVANQSRYPLPSDFIDVLDISHFRGNRYQPLKRQNIRVLRTNLNPSATSNSILFFEISGRMRQVLGSGTADAGGSSTKLVDAAVDLSALGITVNKDYAVNDTDDSRALITVVVGANELTTQALTLGADNTWSEDDSYHIEQGEATLDALNLRPTPATSDTTGTENLRIIYVRYAREMTADTDYTELPQFAYDGLLLAAAIVALEKSKGITSIEVANLGAKLDVEIARIKLFLHRRGRTNFETVQDVGLWGARIPGTVLSATAQDPSPLG
ncbi:MAG: hypothetical protein H8D67_22850 [Deltaproteobacteria bacterium]|nr:hypothetical protein [Deltaproteobacteria bacterium]